MYVSIDASVCFEVLLRVAFHLVLIWDLESLTFLPLQAVIAMFMPGQEEGHALADVLFGVVDPGGRLPVTFPNIENEVWCELVYDYLLVVPLPVCAMLSCYLYRSLCSVAPSGSLSVRLTLFFTAGQLHTSAVPRHPRRQPAQHVLHRKA